MPHMSIDPTRGPHAASHLTDEEVERMVGVAIWEFALRTDPDKFKHRLAEISDARDALQYAIDQVLQERDVIEFAGAVMEDIDRLPVAGAPEPETSHGMYG